MLPKTISCPRCSAVNGAEEASCAKCGESLMAARMEQIAADMRAVTDRAQHQMARTSFSSINGFGTTLLDYTPRGDGTWNAVRWVIAAGIPLVPLGGYVIQPHHEEHTYGRHTTSFTVLERTPLQAQRVARTYLLLIVGLAPVVLGFLNSSWVNRTLGDGKAFFAMLACVAWAGYIVFVRIKNDGKVYKPLPPQVAG
jgi:hypothetical protein